MMTIFHLVCDPRSHAILFLFLLVFYFLGNCSSVSYCFFVRIKSGCAAICLVLFVISASALRIQSKDDFPSVPTEMGAAVSVRAIHGLLNFTQKKQSFT